MAHCKTIFNYHMYPVQLETEGHCERVVQLSNTFCFQAKTYVQYLIQICFEYPPHGMADKFLTWPNFASSKPIKISNRPNFVFSSPTISLGLNLKKKKKKKKNM